MMKEGRQRGALSNDTAIVEVGPSRGVDLPSVGLGMASHGEALSERETDLITALRPGHLRADLHLATDNWRSMLDDAAETSRSTATGLELALFLGSDPEAELEALAAALPLAQARIVRVLVLQDGRPVVAPSVVGMAKSSLAVSGSSFEVDPWQSSLFGAAWTLSSLASLAYAGAASVTYFETTGWRGVMEQERAEGPPAIASRAGAVFPLYHVLADVREWDFGQVGESRSSAPLDLAVLCAHTLDGLRILLANLTPEPRRCAVGPLSAAQVAVRALDESTGRAQRSTARGSALGTRPLTSPTPSPTRA